MHPGPRTGRPAPFDLLSIGLLTLLLIGCGAGLTQPPPTAPIQAAGPAIVRPPTEPPATPTQRPLLSATDSPVSAPALRLTVSGCCTRAFWSPDSRWIAFIDRPSEDRPSGIYAVPVSGGPPELVNQTPGILSASWTTMAYDRSGQTVVERLADGQRWNVPNEGRAVRLSPSGASLAWTMGSQGITHPDLRERIIWTAAADGSGAHVVIRVRGGGIIGWGEAEEHLIVSGRVQAEGPSGLWRIEPENGRAVLLAEVESPQDPLLSPEGGWLAYFSAFDSGPGANGLYVVRTDGSQHTRLEVFGAYRWRQEGQLLVVPLELDEEVPLRLLQIDTSSGEVVLLSVPEETIFAIGGNEWQVSPDGTHLVFLSAVDRSLWVMPLPAP